jgi:DNA-binding MarR family transcriptional regulator
MSGHGAFGARRDAGGNQMDQQSALKLWRDVHLSIVREGKFDLTARQLTVLLTVYLEKPPHTVRGLAKTLNVTKPVITRALDTMGKAGLVSRKRDMTDRRNVIIQRTVEGSLFIEQLGDRIMEMSGKAAATAAD